MTTSGVTILLRESFLHTVTELDAASPDITYKITPIELTFMRNAVVHCEWFLTKKNLLGKVEERTSSSWLTLLTCFLTDRLPTATLKSLTHFPWQTLWMATARFITFL